MKKEGLQKDAWKRRRATQRVGIGAVIVPEHFLDEQA
jgi:hypothetical protein